jgi:hypothetical protein
MPLSEETITDRNTARKPRPVFIHSLFRTGSTWLWQKLRDLPGVHAYYEPLHHILLTLTASQREGFVYDDAATGRMRHPSLSRPHFDEYGGLLEGSSQGLPLFRKSFCYDEYAANDDNPALKAYIDSLIVHASPAQAVLQFNRTGLRCRWFRETWPEALALYLLRNPRDQWQSFTNMNEREGIDIFLVLDLLIASVNRRREPFRRLAAELPLYAFHGESYAEEEAFYRLLLQHYTPAESYLVFFCHWLAALGEGIRHTDLVVDMDRLPSDSGARAQLAETLAGAGLPAFTMDDARSSSYETYSLPVETMAEAEVRALGICLAGDRATGTALLEHFRGWHPAFSHLAEAPPPLAGEGTLPAGEEAHCRAEEALAGMYRLSRREGRVRNWQQPRGIRAFLRRLLPGQGR